jgi:hypothetical protein
MGMVICTNGAGGQMGINVAIRPRPPMSVPMISLYMEILLLMHQIGATPETITYGKE